MKKVIAIIGPTAVGKTKLSVELAKKLNGEIINADSTQIYKDLNIATAKIREDEKNGIVHHLFDIANVKEDYTVYDYQKDVRHLIDDITSRGKIPILCGGTGLYIKAALYDYVFTEEDGKKETVNFDNLSNEKLYEIIYKHDPNTKIHINNRQRLIRTYNSIIKNGVVPNKNSNKILYNVRFIGLTTARDVLYDRINKRVDIMMENGLLKEAEWVYLSKLRTKAIMTPIGYKELFPYFDNLTSLESCLDNVKKSSRRYAKRQYTWFNNQFNTVWYDVDFINFDNTIKTVIKDLKNNFLN